MLSKRRNIIVVVDEAHRSHYDDLDGYARHLKDALPHATLIAFTETPISFADRDTRAVFGDYVDGYDLTRAVRDGATVPVYFEPRLIKVGLRESVSEEDLDRAADDVTVGLDAVERAQLEKSVAVVNAIYGAPDRIRALAEDLVAHWEARRQAMQPLIEVPGKALIVGGTREICANLYEVSEVAGLVEGLLSLIREALAGLDWRSRIVPGRPKSWYDAAMAMTNYLRFPTTPGNQIARELVAIMRRDVRTDWTVREDVRAKLRSSIKRLLVKYKYPPDKQPGAIKLVMEQMEQLAPRYAAKAG